MPKRLIEAGILYSLSGREAYARYVHEALEHFTRHYEDYPLANNLLGPTRLFQSTFLEAFWLADMVIAYDLARKASCFNAEDHKAIRNLFYKSSEIVKSFDENRSNRQAFNNVGMGAVGLLYDDDLLIDHVLNGPHGFSFHMLESLLEDGLWYEGETYHFATLDHLLDLAELARHRNIDLYGPLKPMFDGPLKVMYPDGTFPSRKDSWFGRGILYHKDIYELGYARYGEARYGGLLAQAYRQGGREDLSWRSFLYLEPELPEIPLENLRPQTCERMPGTGVAILRREEGSVYASMEYGRYGGGHGHPDRLHLSFYADDSLWFLDPGTGWYHVPELGWYRATLAHNTVVVDGMSQSRCEGRLTAFGDAGDFQVAQALVKGAYQGVAMRRTLLLSKDYLLDVFDLISDEEHTYDWALHTRADLHLQGHIAKEEVRLGDRNGYEFLREVSRLQAPELKAELMSGQNRLRLLQLMPSPSEDDERVGATGQSPLQDEDRQHQVDEGFCRAKAIGIPLQEDIPFNTVIVRRRARSTRYATLYLRDAAGEQARLSEGGGFYLLELGREMHKIHLDASDGIAILVEREGAVQALSSLRRQAAFPSLSIASDRRLPYVSLWREGSSLTVELPADFGRLYLHGLGSITQVTGLPAGASWEAIENGLCLTQNPGVHVWLADDEEHLTLFAGCENTLRFHLAIYSASEGITPALELPDDWQLLDLKPLAQEISTLWEAIVRLPPQARASKGELYVAAAGERLPLPFEIASPLATEWQVRSSGGQPEVLLRIEERRGESGQVQGEIVAPWLLEKPHAFELALAAHEVGVVRLPLPLAHVPPRESDSSSDPVWELPGKIDSAGEYALWARVRLESFAGLSRARFPLCWSTRRGAALGARLALNRPEQAYWTEEPWQGEGDIAAWASLEWDEAGFYLQCEVRDDVHVSGANEDDLYENDSIQLYFDFRPEGRRSADFSPGVAAYILAPAAGKRGVRIQAIVGNREISNRAAKAGWFTAAGLEASCEPTTFGYAVKAFFPYSSLSASPLKPGDVIGFDLAVSDNDGTLYRKLQLVWSGARGRRLYLRGSYHNPLEFGYLIIGGDRGA